MAATSQLAQTTLRSVLGKHELDEMLAERDRLNAAIQEILDQQTDAWGIKVVNIEIKDIDLAENMVRAIAKQAEAERLRRAKVINASGQKPAIVAASASHAGNVVPSDQRFLTRDSARLSGVTPSNIGVTSAIRARTSRPGATRS